MFALQPFVVSRVPPLNRGPKAIDKREHPGLACTKPSSWSRALKAPTCKLPGLPVRANTSTSVSVTVLLLGRDTIGAGLQRQRFRPSASWQDHGSMQADMALEKKLRSVS